MLKTNLDLFVAFFRAGMLGYGGGPSSIPLFHKEAVDRYKWLTADEFGDILALGNSLPGPIATKLAGYIGYRVSGVMGMLVATLATVVPTVFIMGILLTYLYSLKEATWVEGMTTAVQPVIGVMLFVLAYDFLKKSWKGKGAGLTIFLTAVSLAVLQVMGLHPAILIGALLLYALLIPDKAKNNEEEKREVSR